MNFIFKQAPRSVRTLCKGTEGELHARRSEFSNDIHGIIQLIAQEGSRYSLSCNPDLTIDVAELYRKAGKKLHVIGVVHPDLPFLEGEAEVSTDFFSAILHDPEKKEPKLHHELLALPRQPVDEIDHAIGFYASQLIRDGGHASDRDRIPFA